MDKRATWDDCPCVVLGARALDYARGDKSQIRSLALM